MFTWKIVKHITALTVVKKLKIGKNFLMVENFTSADQTHAQKNFVTGAKKSKPRQGGDLKMIIIHVIIKSSAMTNTILYEIPASFFPGCKLTKPFHAKVNYAYVNGNVIINDAAFSDLCLEYIRTRGLSARMKKDIAEAERKKMSGNINPIISSALAPFINS